MSTLKELQSLGAIVSDVPVKKTIKFKLDSDEEITAEIYVRRLSIGDYETSFELEAGQKSSSAKTISEAIRLGEDGQEKISFADAYKLHPGIASAMAKMINEVNGIKAKN